MIRKLNKEQLKEFEALLLWLNYSKTYGEYKDSLYTAQFNTYYDTVKIVQKDTDVYEASVND
jgi:hypothetical protein